jgi:hypothetical protein
VDIETLLLAMLHLLVLDGVRLLLLMLVSI